MTRASKTILLDQEARDQALDTTRSILVQAPAGSGKTELLTMRFLKLLAMVEEPEQVLAITFTKAATAEMRHRILSKLEQVRSNEALSSEDFQAVALARAALANSNQRGWRLLEQSQRLNIQTIDSLCLGIAHQMPLTARLSGTLEPTENAQPLYRDAARRTLDQLGGSDVELNAALTSLLTLRDSNLRDCESLLTGMLGTRDQWMRAFPLAGEIDWEQARVKLEAPLQREIGKVLNEAHALLSSHPMMTAELLELADYACNSTELKIDIKLLAGLQELPGVSAEFIQHWHCLCDLLLTNEGQPRKRYDITTGFPPKKNNAKQRMNLLVGDLTKIPRLHGLLVDIRNLPPARYSEQQWKTLRSMFTALRHAAVELNSVFAERGSVDFVEIGMAARAVLLGIGAEGLPSDRGTQIHHLLIDEFQDTSRRQHELIALLLQSWTADAEDGRTFFLVGDPMQSIYMFRQADVELFDLVRRQGLNTGKRMLPVKDLHLQTNFRSSAGIVKPLNSIFKIIFPHNANAEAAAVDFLPGVAKNMNQSPGAYQVHPDYVESAKNLQGDDADEDDRSLHAGEADQGETSRVLEIIHRHLPTIEAAQRDGKEFTVAVLARAKNHLIHIAAALREQQIPFRAIELENLGGRQEILDLQSLTRALLHPMDRIAWLALLRAPWCALELREIHLLCGTDDRQRMEASVARQIEERICLLTEEAQRRVSRLTSVLQTALRSRYSQTSFASWIERTWRSLGGAACVDVTGYENALAYFRMLERVSPDGIGAMGEEFSDQLNRLFARPDPETSERCGIQLMTIHKAKGLGFNVVLLPGLHKRAQRDAPSLIRYLERTTGEGIELLAAPIDSKGEDTSALNRWVQLQRDNREAEERKRLLYVACTRAREELHLFGTATVTNSTLSSKPGTLLNTAWPALEPVFVSRRPLPVAEPIQGILAFPPPASSSSILSAIAAGAAVSTIQRLPANWSRQTFLSNVTKTVSNTAVTADVPVQDQRRPQGARSSRTLGTVVHALFERSISLRRSGLPGSQLLAGSPRLYEQALGLARHEGLTPGDAEACAKLSMKALRFALEDEEGVWILTPRDEDGVESSWTGLVDGVARTLRIDRFFRAGAEPLSEGSDCLWIIDYKTAAPNVSGFLDEEQLIYREQLESYGRMMRLAHGDEVKLRLGLYYPLLKKLLWWAA
ncbi:ATP-dependent DNA helicase pcrA [Acidisarcina polymorpha]|uniref:DNA 3'-5' helicase n=1 Tax=Acidisarcina polymorpha TaxID=2211140 RepID=A0A2Z5FZ92_9BACT|nr:UvrD-helicase domain-containing protein [Acidisarcina polymorpha]AXC11854.1 ATP-dependent DNA helicase pcrA [Acidisarcina polymorpha]